MSESVVVIASVTPRSKERGAVLALITSAVPEVIQNDAGCLLYAIHENDAGFVMVEKWENGAAFEAHVAGQTFQALMSHVGDKLEQAVDVQVVRPIPVDALEQASL